MHRRSFLKRASLGTLAVSLFSTGPNFLSVEEAAAGIIRHHFHFLKLDPAGVAAFVADYYTFANARAQKGYTANLKTKAYYLLHVKSERSQMVRELTTLYLMSTDFFRNRMDETRAVHYLGWYDPYQIPCANPFSNLYYPPATSQPV